MINPYATSFYTAPKYAKLAPLHPGFDDQWEVRVVLNVCEDTLHYWVVCEPSLDQIDPLTPRTRIDKAGLSCVEVGYRRISLILTGWEYRKLYAELTGGVQ